MPGLGGIGFWFVVVFAFVLLAVFAIALIVRQYKRCPSNRILVVYGRIGGERASKCIHGGGVLVIPLIQDYAYLALEPLVIEIPLTGALSLNNIRVNVPSTFTVGISTDPVLMNNAAERLLNLPVHARSASRHRTSSWASSAWSSRPSDDRRDQQGPREVHAPGQRERRAGDQQDRPRADQRQHPRHHRRVRLHPGDRQACRGGGHPPRHRRSRPAGARRRHGRVHRRPRDAPSTSHARNAGRAGSARIWSSSSASASRRSRPRRSRAKPSPQREREIAIAQRKAETIAARRSSRNRSSASRSPRRKHEATTWRETSRVRGWRRATRSSPRSRPRPSVAPKSPPPKASGSASCWLSVEQELARLSKEQLAVQEIEKQRIEIAAEAEAEKRRREAHGRGRRDPREV
jgi:flotillin